jgi:hypothetical protein
MGFGFVETDSEAAAKAAIKALQVRLIAAAAHELRCDRQSAHTAGSS